MRTRWFSQGGLQLSALGDVEGSSRVLRYCSSAPISFPLGRDESMPLPRRSREH